MPWRSPQAGIEPQIRGRKAEFAAALVAVDHRAGHEPGIAEKLRRLVDPPAASASRIGPDDTGRPSSSKRGTTSTAKPRFLPSAARKSGEPARLHAEMKIEADHRAADGEALDQNAPTNSSAVSLASAASKVSTIAPSSPVAARSRNLAASSVSRNSCSPRIKEGARMRLEGQRGGRLAKASGAMERRGDDGAVAAMHPVEISDGDDGATQGVIGVARRRAR